MKIKNKINGGYTVLELLFYISFFVILVLVVISAMITMTRSFRETRVNNEWIQSGIIMERMSREIRQAYGVNTISVSDLKLNTKDSSGTNKTVEFILSGTDIQFNDNDVFTGNLNTPDIVVTNLAFSQITTVKGIGIKISLSFRSTADAQSRVQTFYNTIVLRGSY
jgi:hypothetical protein